MPKAVLNGIKVYYEVHGKGFPLLLHLRKLSLSVEGGSAQPTPRWSGEVSEVLVRP